MNRRRARLAKPKVVTFCPDPDRDGVGTVSCSWEERPRKQPITPAAARKFAEGWKATFKMKARW